ncbi:N-acetylmuramoyl-L-alanine amidase [bacterium]|nr:N-acetylmuramoyl-L-alanine amidase [bacterium]
MLRTRHTLLLGLLLVGVLVPPAVRGQAAADTYRDPLAYTRVAAAAEAVPWTIRNQATGETRQAMGRYLLLDSREFYVRSATLATVLQASRYWDGRLRRLDLKIGGQSFGLTADTRVVRLADGELLMPVPVLDHEGDLWLPMTFVTAVVGPRAGERISWDDEGRKLTVGTAEYNVTRLRAEVLGRSTAVHVECAAPLGYRATSPRSGVIELKIYGAEVNAGRLSLGGRGLLRSARTRQLDDHAVITFEVDQLVGRYRTYAADEGRDIVLVLEEEQVSAIPDPVPLGRADLNIEQGVVDVTNEIRLQTVVIDPGHGGHDVGAVGTRGIMEKDVNLGVARELKRYLRDESDLRVVLTRERDEYLELADRAEIANTNDGDIFISLHCNSWFNDGAHGLETYFLSPAQSDWAKSVEAAENATPGAGAPAGDVDFIVWELVQNRFISSSSQLAEIIQADMTAALGLPNRGVRQAGFRVLVGAYMPAVLIELGFLSHKSEEEKLGDRTYQRQLAAALGEAILTYRKQLSAPPGDASGDATGGEAYEDNEPVGGERRD